MPLDVKNDILLPAVSAIARFMRSLSPGIWLCLLYFIFGTLVVFSMTAHQLQFAVHSYKTKEGAPIGLWQIRKSQSEWSVNKRLLDSEIESRLRFTKELEAARIDSDISSLKFENGRGECIAAVNSIIFEFSESGVSPNEASMGGFDCGPSSIPIFSMLKKLRPESDPNDTKSRFDAQFDRAFQLYNELNAKYLVIGSDFSKIDELEKKIAASNSEIERLTILSTKIIESFNSAEIGDALEAMIFLDNFERSYSLPDFSSMPSGMLTLLLVMSMGALGGSIHLTQLYIIGPENTADYKQGPAYLLFRPLLGAIIGVAVYILFKSGVSIVSAPPPGGNGAELSPFFIAFVGIVSGLLAEDAINTIQRIGRTWFSSTQNLDQPRWAYGLAALVEKGADGLETDASKKKFEYLKNVLDVKSEKIKNWITEDEAVSLADQKVIAAFFQKNIRDIFSDLKSTP